MTTSEEIARSYICGTHGSLPNINYEAVSELLSDDFEYTNECERHTKTNLLTGVYPGWSSIVKGASAVRILALAKSNLVIEGVDSEEVLAHWETDYDCCDNATWYGTDVDISGKQVRNFQVFAQFTIKEGKINKIVQRSDTVVKTLQIEEAVLAYRAAHK
jgi:ketosteroid isomerase-like protein